MDKPCCINVYAWSDGTVRYGMPWVSRRVAKLMAGTETVVSVLGTPKGERVVWGQAPAYRIVARQKEQP